MKKYLLLLCFVFMAPACTEDEVATPSACFTISPSSPVTMGDAINFKNCSENATEFHWDFDDGSSSTEKDPTHSFTQSGSFEVVLIAYNGSRSDHKTPSDTTMIPILTVVYVKSQAGK